MVNVYIYQGYLKVIFTEFLGNMVNRVHVGNEECNEHCKVIYTDTPISSTYIIFPRHSVLLAWVIRVIRVIIRMNIDIHERDASSLARRITPQGSLLVTNEVIRVIRAVSYYEYDGFIIALITLMTILANECIYERVIYKT